MTASKCARVVELADSLDSGSSAHYGRAGSSPASRTKLKAGYGLSETPEWEVRESQGLNF